MCPDSTSHEALRARLRRPRSCSAAAKLTRPDERARATGGGAVTTTAFVNGCLFDGHSYRGPGEVLVRGGRIVEVSTAVDRAGAALVDLAGGLLAPGFV